MLASRSENMPTPYDHQKTGSDILARNACWGLFDEQGLGKTITSILAAKKAGLRRILLVVPAVVLWNWEHEFGIWGDPLLTRRVLQTGRDQISADDDVVFVSHGLFWRDAIFSQLCAIAWDLLVIDEMHCFKSPFAMRTKRLLLTSPSLLSASRYVWCLTGTPVPNNAADIWSFLYGLFPERITDPRTKRPMHFEAFRQRYCVLRPSAWGFVPVGNRNVSELREKLQGTFLRRLKRDELPNLPPLRFETVVLDSPDLPEILEQLDPSFTRQIQRVRAKIDNDDAYDESSWEALRKHSDLGLLRRLTGAAKVAPLVKLLREELRTNAIDKLVIFAHHKDTVKGYADKLQGFGVETITGAASTKRRAETVQRFQTQASPRVVVCNILAAGTGITLTAATEVVFAEMDFCPGNNAQAADRVHRIGQTKRTRVRVFTLRGTADEAVTSILLRKVAMIRELL